MVRSDLKLPSPRGSTGAINTVQAEEERGGFFSQIRGLAEAAVNKVEDVTGIDIDGDGDIGLPDSPEAFWT